MTSNFLRTQLKELSESNSSTHEQRHNPSNLEEWAEVRFGNDDTLSQPAHNYTI